MDEDRERKQDRAFAATPEPPYLAVIFTSRRPPLEDDEGYAEAAARMMELAARQDGFLGVESAGRDENGVGITVSYWRDDQAIANWKADAEHKMAQEQGFARWYQGFALRVARIERQKIWQSKGE